jgi:hypothetical protein
LSALSILPSPSLSTGGGGFVVVLAQPSAVPAACVGH